MSDMRKGDMDPRKRRYRSGSRFFVSGGLWYFSTREGTVEGPFSDRYSAEKVLEGYALVMDSAFPVSELSLADDAAPQAAAPRSVHLTELGIGRIVPLR